MNRLMLRFRPIAPKPVGGEAASGKTEEERLNSAGKRTKRKYVRVRGRRITKKSSPPERSVTEDESSPEKVTATETLQLLPERSEIRDNYKICGDNSSTVEENWNIKNNSNADDDVVLQPRSVRSVTETMVIVERVTDTCTESSTGVEGGLGFSDEDKIKSLQQDTCPAFISDGENKVVWVNEAYKKMVAAEGFMVWLVVKEDLPRFCPDFACRVRLIQHRGQGHKWNRIVPCDVWRMEFAGFAWKLDVNTALGLSL